ncbi:MAG TPA: alpha/beta fold hydrolase [Solirubrobacteraceae bacterium]|nr:alpha/beta fold hydrolase [Solirubrobacteraceae bacterium]
MPRSEDIRVRAGDIGLAATLTLPDGETDGRLPWALLVPSWLPRDRGGGWDATGHPGWFAQRDQREPPGLFERLAGALAARGVASLRYDPRGCGESGGDWAASNLFTRIDDARDAIGAMRSRRELDLRRTAIVGHGEGAVIAISVAIGDPAIGAVGLVGPPARSFRDVLRRGVAERQRTGRDREHPVVAALDDAAEELIERAVRRDAEIELRVADASVRLSLAGWEQAIHTPALALATMLHRHVVIAHGTRDAWADPDESRLLTAVLAEAGNEPVLQLLIGVGHDLAEAEDDRIGAFADALVAGMEPRELPPVLLAIEEMTGDPGATLDSRS